MGMSRQQPAQEEPKNDLGIEKESFATAQEAVPLPFLAGKRKIAPIWITRIINQRSVEAEQERPGKK